MVGKTCQRCDNDAVIITRGQDFCKDCFVKFIRGKQRKMMMGLNGRKSDVKVMIPVSLESNINNFLNCENVLCLVDILVNFQRSLYKSYLNITILGVEETDNHDRMNEFFSKLKQFYNLENNEIQFKVINMLDFVSNKSLVEIKVVNNAATYFITEKKFSSFEEYAATMTGTSSKEDLIFNIQWNLIQKYASLHEFDSIVFANSMSSLAVKILSSVVKGKGAEVSQILKEDDESKILYPLKDILKKEVSDYNGLLKLREMLPEAYFDNLPPEKVVNLRTATMNQIVGEYFVDLENSGYSTMVATVVATGSKLDIPKKNIGVCEACGFQMAIDATNWLNSNTVGEEKVDIESGDLHANAKLCYGCLVTFKSVQTPWPQNDKQAILDEYLLE